jgi:hypothetical protein
MNRQKPILFIIVLALIGATAGALAHAKANQKLGLPGVKTRALTGSKNLEVVLPADLPGYTSKVLVQAEVVTNQLPKDTSFGQRLYTADDGFETLANVVLMGSSRASIHKPQICLTAQGWNINDATSRQETVHVDKPVPYELPVMRLTASREAEVDGQKVVQQGVYVYWFADADRYTASQAHWKIWTAQDIVFKSELDRWAYITFFSVGAPGQEDAMYERMKKLIATSVPEFQLVPLAAK